MKMKLFTTDRGFRAAAEKENFERKEENRKTDFLR